MNNSYGWQLAVELKELLQDSCARIEVAGGLRRGKENPHDIELVCKPSPKEIFGYANTLDERMWQLLMDGKIIYGDKSKNGKLAPFSTRYYRIRYQGEKVDIFSVLPPAQFGVIYLIRTGDAGFSHWFVNKDTPRESKLWTDTWSRTDRYWRLQKRRMSSG